MTDEVANQVIVEQGRGPRTERQGAPTLSGKKSWTAQEVRRGSKGPKRKAQKGKGPTAKGREYVRKERVVNCVKRCSCLSEMIPQH